MSAIVHIDNLAVAYGQTPVLQQLSWTIERGSHYVLAGTSGSGKSTLAKAIARLISSSGTITYAFDTESPLLPKAIYVSNWYQFTNLEGDRNFYYQQRYNRHQGQDTLTVRAELLHFAKSNGLDLGTVQDKMDAMGFAHTMDSQLIELSSGEHKKLQLVKALWQKPQLLLIDEPFTGLDTQSRYALNDWLDELAEEGVQLVLITNDHILPAAMNRYAHISNGKLEVVPALADIPQDALRQAKDLPAFLMEEPQTDFDSIADLRNIVVRYGEKVVLKDVSWQIAVGDKWLLQGPNGSGKSTLLSLINGDHPQSYGLDITLFGKKRGSGESIWDIKEKIGMISPEMHWYFDQQATVWHTLASGFYDSIGWFIDVKFQERKQIEDLMAFFDLTEHKDQLLHTLPLGKQRLAMLARSIIKNPPLLVLDEPCQGLDAQQARYFNAVVDELCRHGKTLIYVGHYESQLPQCIEKRIILEKGEVVALENKVENVL
ncbi:ATP-binding cassette domain-containing protein [Sphingobacterium lactis]|uniref:Molybdate transport system ATP-binding protein n=1 Tax=Sphingobacterium lactis TaxID=797291 RepID=A0A1H6AHV7_9SPHI|nr:ATP-binding cassette domain-containing protein [Sphingobacterium lactis]SEG48343.1 molybdate transport system ATP-binding protein [Sphingobacterium lactis]